MANNRMWLKCESCGEHILLCKYYPTDGWYFWHSGWTDTRKNRGGRMRELDEWLHAHRHGDFSMWGPEHYQIRYEGKDDE